LGLNRLNPAAVGGSAVPSLRTDGGSKYLESDSPAGVRSRALPGYQSSRCVVHVPVCYLS